MSKQRFCHGGLDPPFILNLEFDIFFIRYKMRTQIHSEEMKKLPDGNIGKDMERKIMMIRSLLLVLVLMQVSNEGWTKDISDAKGFARACNGLGSSYASYSGDIVTLKKNTEFTSNNLNLTGGNITLNLNGSSLYRNNGDLLMIRKGAIFTVKGSGSIYCGSSTSSTILVDGGTLNISSTVYSTSYESITITNGGVVNILDGADIYTNSSSASLRLASGTVNFKGGQVSNEGGGVSIKIENGQKLEDLCETGYKPYRDNKHLGSPDLIANSISGVITIKPVYTLSTTVTGKGSCVLKIDDQIASWAASGEKVVVEPTAEKGYKLIEPSVLSFDMPASSKNVAIVFQREDYSITYNNIKAGDTNNNPKTYHVESGTISLKDPLREGYRFLGWYNDDQYTTQVTQVEAGDTGNKIFYAYWSQIYTVQYDLNNGVLDGDYVSNFIIEDYKNKDLILPTPKRTGFKFAGWYEDESCIENPVSKIVTPGNKKYYAKWLEAYSITCKWNDGITADWATAYDESDKTIKLPVGITRSGYTFVGWFDNASCTGSSIAEVPQGSTGDKVFYAKWNIIQYKLNFYLYDGNSESLPKSYTVEDEVKLPIPQKANFTFKGWYLSGSFDGMPISTIAKNTTGDMELHAKWSLFEYTITLNTGMNIELSPIPYTVETDGYVLPKNLKRNGYAFAGWYKDKDCTLAFGTTIPKGTNGDFMLYAKWESAKYTITYNTYSDVKVPSSTYTIEEDVTLPVPQRTAYSFAGWYESDRLEGEPIMAIEKGSTGNRTLYAKWSSGSVVNIVKAANGTFTVKNGDTEVKSGDYVGQGTKLTLTATPTAPYTLSKWVVNGKDVTGNPVTVEMPASGGLAISAVFADNRVAASAPEIVTNPVNTDKIAKGETVKVQLQKTDESTSLYYSVDGAPDKAYTGEFMVSSSKDTLVFKAIARKTDYKDGVTTRLFIFDNSRITLTFDLPLGVKATNPTGGDVVTATTTGGSFEFKLTVDKDYYTNLDSMVVSANDSTITGNASGLYTLTNCSSDITVTVSGLKAKTCTVTLQQTENGQIKFTDGADETASEVGYGSSVSITAVADEDFKFLQWNTGSQSNPLNLTVSRDTTISARFISDYKSYMMTLPQMEGVTVKPFSGYSTEVKKDGTFKFYLVLAKGYREGNLVVRANGEELTKNKGGYAIYHINKNISISVDGIVRDSIKLTLPDHVTAKVVETMSDVAGQGLFEETMLLLQAKAPEGKIFSKWTDGKTDNPRMATAVDAAQLIPLFTDKEDAAYAKVILNQSPGAGITGANSNMDAVKSGDVVQLKVVLLPAYSQSEVVLTADDKVLIPETSLRAASETKTYVYNLPVDKDGITVKVSGLKLNSYEVAVSQTNGGTVSAVPAGKVIHGDKVQLKAEAASGMLFVKWWDGNTLNPYPYTVTSDTEVKACFVGTESTVDNESIRKDDKVSVSVTGRVLSVAVAEKSALYIWDYKGSLFRNQTIPAGEYTMSLPSGVYLVKVGDMIVRKVVVR